MALTIRLAHESDLTRLQLIESSAFYTLKNAGGVDGEPTFSSLSALRKYLSEELLFVSCDSHNHPVGFVGGYGVDNELHISEVNVAPEWQRNGIGWNLLIRILEEGKKRSYKRVTLTTDRLVPFNAPFYQKLGFSILDEHHLSPRLLNILSDEINSGFHSSRRVAMEFIYSI